MKVFDTARQDLENLAADISKNNERLEAEIEEKRLVKSQNETTLMAVKKKSEMLSQLIG